MLDRHGNDAQGVLGGDIDLVCSVWMIFAGLNEQSWFIFGQFVTDFPDTCSTFELISLLVVANLSFKRPLPDCSSSS